MVALLTVLRAESLVGCSPCNLFGLTLIYLCQLRHVQSLQYCFAALPLFVGYILPGIQYDPFCWPHDLYLLLIYCTCPETNVVATGQWLLTTIHPYHTKLSITNDNAPYQ